MVSFLESLKLKDMGVLAAIHKVDIFSHHVVLNIFAFL